MRSNSPCIIVIKYLFLCVTLTMKVTTLRAHFSRDIDEFSNTANIIRLVGETDAAHRLRVEAAWIATQGPNSELALNVRNLDGIADEAVGSSFAASTTSGTFNDFLIGLWMGYLFGFIMIFCIRDRLTVLLFDYYYSNRGLIDIFMDCSFNFPPNSNMNQRRRLGVSVGVLLNMLMTNMQQQQRYNEMHKSHQTHSPTPLPNATTSLVSLPASTTSGQMHPLP